MVKRPVSDLKLHGGHPALDFANSLDDRGTPQEQDFIEDYDAFILWCGHAGVLDVEQAQRLMRWGKRHPAEAVQIAADAAALREALRALLAARDHGKPPDPAQLRTLNEAVPTRSLLDFAEGRFRLRHAESAGREPLGILALSAVQLLASDLSPRIRCCEGDGCDWYFLDRSRSRPRRWCSMAGCGNRAKGRRHSGRAKIERARKRVG